jgi:hypothetical protein
MLKYNILLHFGIVLIFLCCPVRAGNYLNVLGNELQSCSSDGMALTKIQEVIMSASMFPVHRGETFVK